MFLTLRSVEKKINSHENLKAYWLVKLQLWPYLLSAKDGEKWFVSRPGHIYLGEWVPDIQ